MDDKKLEQLIELCNEYWNEDEIDVDLANKIINKVPSLVREIEHLRVKLSAYREL